MRRAAFLQATDCIDDWLAYRVRTLDIPGVSLAILCGDDRFEHAYGLADEASGEALTSKHLFCVASQTKMLLATLLLQLVGAGKLGLDDRMVAYLPWLAQHSDQRMQSITVRQLATHSAGLPREAAPAGYWHMHEPFPDEQKLRAAVLAAQLTHPPNTALKYSNLGFALLGQVVQAASGQTWPELAMPLLREAAMQTAALDSRSVAAPLATGYGVLFERSRRPLGVQPARALAPSAGLCATPADMCRFAAGHFLGNETFLSDAQKREMQRVQWSVPNGFDAGYAYGIGCELFSIGGRRFVGHTGHAGGHTTVTLFDPSQRCAVSVAANCKDAPCMQIARGIVGILDFFAQHATQPTPPRLRKLDTWLYSPLAIVRIVAVGDSVVAVDPDEWEPFAWPDRLEALSARALRICSPGNVATDGEFVHYKFAAGRVQSVSYGGIPMWPTPSAVDPGFRGQT
ncbi:MAG TPA: serine hydrolase domain-containing protein [Candidatus Saccharimonadales bacterium]|nr:serine hydrolase domain-containing protein [Candidatus Saccharimonadales bacterium]